MKQKFEIIEEGRLSQSEMGKISGGQRTCVPADMYKVTLDCGGAGTSYSFCPTTYHSCTGQGGPTPISCGRNYSGPTGPDGYGILDSAIRIDVAYKELCLDDSFAGIVASSHIVRSYTLDI